MTHHQLMHTSRTSNRKHNNNNQIIKKHHMMHTMGICSNLINTKVFKQGTTRINCMGVEATWDSTIVINKIARMIKYTRKEGPAMMRKHQWECKLLQEARAILVLDLKKHRLLSSSSKEDKDLSNLIDLDSSPSNNNTNNNHWSNKAMFRIMQTINTEIMEWNHSRIKLVLSTAIATLIRVMVVV